MSLGQEAARSATAWGCDPRVQALIPAFDAPFFLAGLAGYSAAPMRHCARQAGAPYCVTEAMRADALVRGGKALKKASPDRRLHGHGGRFQGGQVRAADQQDHPLAAQIIGGEPDEMARAAALLAQMPFEVLDVNLACPQKKRGGSRSCQGGALLMDPDRALEILRSVRQAVAPEIPTTVKLRRGYDDSREAQRHFERVFDGAYELGYSWATVHCRTVEQRYDGPGHWPFLANLVKRRPDRVIFGSGDVWTAPDIFRMLESTGVHAVAVARGAIASPWIFENVRVMTTLLVLATSSIPAS